MSDTLPELPKPHALIVGLRLTPSSTRESWEMWGEQYGDDNGQKQHVFTTEQMRAFAQAAITADRSAREGEAVGTLKVRRNQRHMEDAYFEYTGDLPDSSYPLYTAPADRGVAEAVLEFVLGALCEERAAYEDPIAHVDESIKMLEALGVKYRHPAGAEQIMSALAAAPQPTPKADAP